MNKIILDREKNIDLKIIEDSVCNIDENYEIEELNIKLEDNVKFIINHYSIIKENDLKINIIQNNNTFFTYNHSFINKESYNLNVNIFMTGDKSTNIINIHGISDDSKTNIVINGNVDENTNNNELNEKIKIINMTNGESSIKPNMLIDTKNVIANHSASISNIDENYLFYLNSKGIDNEGSKKLIIDGFLQNDAKNRR